MIQVNTLVVRSTHNKAIKLIFDSLFIRIYSCTCRTRPVASAAATVLFVLLLQPAFKCRLKFFRHISKVGVNFFWLGLRFLLRLFASLKNHHHAFQIFYVANLGNVFFVQTNFSSAAKASRSESSSTVAIAVWAVRIPSHPHPLPRPHLVQPVFSNGRIDPIRQHVICWLF